MTEPTARYPMSGFEFVAFIAALMAVNALGVDLMLPALADIGRDLAIVTANDRQWIVTAYIFGFGIGQIFYGPLADRFGRKPVVVVALLCFVGAAAFAAHSASFAALLGARVLQGLTSAASRVLSVAIVRDRFSGRQMARTLSVAQTIFFVFPILAPTLGSLVLAFGPWRLIFYALAGYTLVVLLWTLLRFAETLPRARRIPISWPSLRQSYRLTLTDRFSLGYAVSSALTFGGIVAFVSSSQQIFVDEFHAGGKFTILFAVCAFSMGCAAFANSRLVERPGMRLISQSAVFGLIALSLVHVAIIASGHESLATYIVFQALSMTCIALCGSNFGAMAMERVGHIAGTASSVQGFIASVGAVVVAAVIGQSYDGTTLPLALGYLSIGVVALGLILWIEGGRLFQARAGA
ncbi:multidrug effflux MFS transporter [Sphingomonas pollutisoli]|uniref:multidrug effflux MFS transporter n=1 Tax=Sphingomonas pollutisoli TaxID=3030829 RepID=UPI003B837820